MNEKQFDLITAKRFPRLSPQCVQACREVIFDHTTAYSAETRQGLVHGSVSRYVNRIHAEFAFCEEVAKCG